VNNIQEFYKWSNTILSQEGVEEHLAEFEAVWRKFQLLISEIYGREFSLDLLEKSTQKASYEKIYRIAMGFSQAKQPEILLAQNIVSFDRNNDSSTITDRNANAINENQERTRNFFAENNKDDARHQGKIFKSNSPNKNKSFGASGEAVLEINDSKTMKLLQDFKDKLNSKLLGAYYNYIEKLGKASVAFFNKEMVKRGIGMSFYSTTCPYKIEKLGQGAFYIKLGELNFKSLQESYSEMLDEMEELPKPIRDQLKNTINNLPIKFYHPGAGPLPQPELKRVMVCWVVGGPQKIYYRCYYGWKAITEVKELNGQDTSDFWRNSKSFYPKSIFPDFIQENTFIRACPSYYNELNQNDLSKMFK
jgi:hypothetical protein